MNLNWKDYRKKKHQFRSYYCGDCNQRKSCGKLNQSFCCPCQFQMEQKRTEECLTYESTLATKQRERQATLIELKQLRTWKESSRCSYCGKKAIQQDWLLGSELVCEECKGGHAENCFMFWQKWYKKYWKIDLVKWLEKYSSLPVNKNCADKWLKESNHLDNCQCLEIEAKEIYELFANSLKKSKEKLKECRCEISPKLRVSYIDSEGSGWIYCEKCEKRIESAGHHGVIKNRNDPKFWGLSVKERVLCGKCLEKNKKKMPPLRRAEFNRYRKVGRV